MAIRKRRIKAVQSLGRVARLTGAVLERQRRERRAFATMPRPVHWDWARERLIPLLAGPMIDPPGEELVRSVVPPGVTVAFGLDLGQGVAPYVDVPVAQRWESSADQICAAAMENLRRRSANIPPGWVTTGTLSGHRVQLLAKPAGWAASLLLVPEQLKRLLGSLDQVIGAPSQSLLLSAPIAIASEAFAELLLEYEMKEIYPLMLDPFCLYDGELLWGGTTDPED